MKIVCTALLFFIGYILVPGVQAHVLDGTTHTTQLLIDGDDPQSVVHDGDVITGVTVQNTTASKPSIVIQDINNFTLKNCTVSNSAHDGIQILRASNIRIEGCAIQDIKGSGIDLSSTVGNDTQNVLLLNNQITSAAKDGINSSQRNSGTTITVDHTGLIVRGNILTDIGTSTAHHGMYIQSSDALIEENTINKTTGNGISMRSSGIIRGNRVINTYESCYKYFNDHLPGSSNTFLVENNFCYIAPGGDSGQSAIYLSDTDVGKRVAKYIIRFNSIFLGDSARAAFKASPDFHTTDVIHVYGNAAVNPDIHPFASDQAYIPAGIDVNENNFTSDDPNVFANTSASSYDLHLSPNSEAIGFATGITQPHPQTDIDGETRSSASLDAGADQTGSVAPSISQQPSPVPTLNETACEKKSQGDADCNGVVNFVDYDYYRRIVLLDQSIPLSVNADFNGDNEIGTMDGKILFSSLSL